MQTEDVFRDANQRIAKKARELGLEQPIPFLCECSDRGCFAHIRLMLRDYDEVRADPQRYLTISGHKIAGAQMADSSH